MDFSLKMTVSGPLFERPADVVQEHLDRFMTMLTAYLLREVKQRTPIGAHGAQGGLLGSIQMELEGLGTPLIRGMVMTANPYGDIIERGRRPGKWPPGGKDKALSERPLLPWLILKFGAAGKKLDQLEFLVRRKIGRVGFKGAAMFFRAYWENQDAIARMAQAEGLEISLALGGTA